MARTRLRGIGIGGLRIAVEAPAAWDWVWPDPQAAFRCVPTDPDVYVSVRVGTPDVALRDPTVYAFARGTFEVGRCGGEWGVVVRDDRGVRSARFDSRLRLVEVVASCEAALADPGHHPLAHPLDELLVLHRVTRDGGLLVRGRLRVRDGHGTLVLGGDTDRVVLRAESGRVRAWCTPWGRAAAPVGAALGVVHAPRAGGAAGTRRLDEGAAAATLLSEVVAPIHCHELAIRAAAAVEAVAARVPVVRIALPEAEPVVAFAWNRREAGLGFALPPGL